MEKLNRVIELDQYNREAYGNRALVYRALNEPIKAEADEEIAIKFGFELVHSKEISYLA